MRRSVCRFSPLLPIIQAVKKPIGERFSDALPHFGAVGASLIVYFALFVPLALLDQSLRILGFIVFVVLMASPVIGAVIVLTLQGKQGPRFKSTEVRPYVRGFIVGIVAMLTLFLEGVFPFFNENGIGVVITSSAFITLLIVPFVIPTLRFLMWLVSPPSQP